MTGQDYSEECYWRERNGSREMCVLFGKRHFFRGLSTPYSLRTHTYNCEIEAGLNLRVVQCGVTNVVPFVLALYRVEN
jgi:hypothetical protein